MEIFRGYISTNGKAANMRFKNADDLLTYDDAKNRDSFAGVLANNIVLVDVDDPDQSETLYKIIVNENIRCKVYQTDRGKHFYFINNDKVDKCSVNSRLYIGLNADFKIGKKNSYAVLKKEGSTRKIIRDLEPQEIPQWMLPTTRKIDFMHKAEGEGRNNALYNSIPSLMQIMSREAVIDTLRIINDYVFSAPLSEDEFKTITRDDSFRTAKPDFFIDNKFRHDVFGEYLINAYRIIKIDNVLHMYKDGVYEYGDDQIEALMIDEISDITSNKRSETMKYIYLKAPEKNAETTKYIAFANGLYDITNRSFGNFNPEIILVNKIPHNYNPAAKDPDHKLTKLLDTFANGDNKVVDLVKEMFGYTFYPTNSFQKVFILRGEKSNGKSTLLELLRNIHGTRNISALDMAELSDRFKTIRLYRKTVNVGDDIGDEFLKGMEVSLFKKIATGEAITAEEKGKPAFEFVPGVKLIFSANEIPPMKDNGAALRRMCIVPCEHEFKETDPDYNPNIREDLKNESLIEYMILLALEGLEKLIRDNGFLKLEKVEKAIRDYEAKSSNFVAWVREYDEIPEIYERPTDEVYQDYLAFCADNGLSYPLSKIQFCKKVCKDFNANIKQIYTGGKRYKKFIEIVPF